MTEAAIHTYQDIIACDLSMRRPGFAVQRYYPVGGKVRVVEVSNVDNKTHTNHKCHGEILLEIARELRRYMTKYPMADIVREEALSNISTSARTVQVQHKVVGISDLYGWSFGHREFFEIPPKTVKKLVANDPNAEKDAVAAALEQFVGPMTYACDDESDAVAVGVAWLLQQGKIADPYAPKIIEPPKPKRQRKKAAK